MEVKLIRTLGQTVAFLRMAAIELRRIAEREDTIASELDHVASQLDLEAADLLEQLPAAERPAAPAR